MLDNVIFISNNIAIVEYYDSIPLEYPKESFEPADTTTIELLVASSRSVVEDQFTNIKLLFGSWIESGDEDKQLEELYRSRSYSSISLNE
jgi:hypothetical protein